MQTWIISLGRCGPTDCALRLSNGMDAKQYGIESNAWIALGKIDVLLQKIWNERDKYTIEHEYSDSPQGVA